MHVGPKNGSFEKNSVHALTMTNQLRVVKIDRIASEILDNGGDDEALLIGLIEHSNDFYRVMKTSSEIEMSKYCEKFPGFLAYAKMLENLATRLCEKRTQQQKSASSAESMIELQHVMSKALFEMRDLVNLAGNNPEELVPAIKLFLLTVVSTAADLVEVAIPGGGAYLYAEIEAGAKIGGIGVIAKGVQDSSPHYSVSGLDEDDVPTAMNYLGQQLIIALTKAMHELPQSLRNPETQLRGIEALLANLLNQKFDNPHSVLDSLCDHVHMGLNDLTANSEAPSIH